MTPRPNFEFVQMISEEVLELPSLLIQRLPKAAQLYNIVQISLRGKFKEKYDFFRCTGFEPNVTSFVSRLISDTRTYWCILAPACSSVAEEETLAEIMTKFLEIVDWNQHISFNAVDNDIFKHLFAACKNPSGFSPILHKGGFYSMPMETAINMDLGLAKDIAARELCLSDMTTVFKNWKHAAENSNEDFITEAALKLCSIGLLFHGDLVSWGLVLRDGGIHIVHTLEEFRGQGFGGLMMRYLCHSSAAKAGHYPVVHIEQGNEKSVRLMTSVGFEFSHNVTWTEFALDN